MEGGNLFIISAPSGTGKSTILRHVMASVERIVFSISHTTRPPRQGEREGVDYFFVDRRDFLELRDHDGFLEWAEVHGNLYGTSRRAVEEQLARGLDVICDIDVQGAGQIREISTLKSTSVFIVPPSWEELEKRLMSRGTDDPQTVKLRLANARKEIRDMNRYDHLIVNDTATTCADMVRAIILSRRSADRRDMKGSPLDFSFLEE